MTVNTIFKHSDPSDLNEIQKIAKKTIDQSYRYFLGDETVDHYLKSDHLDTYLRKNIDRAWSLHQEHNILGFSVCIDNVIDFMVIDAGQQRKGFGTMLLKHCENYLFENHRVIALESFEEHAIAHRFYEANNWKKIAKYKDTEYNAVKHIFRKHHA
ncbi:MAG: GNAT family N-acetyltransferase [Gammaproteobacteria bacterium]